MTLSWTVPKNLVAASQFPLPAGRTFGQAARGPVKLTLTMQLSASMIRRLQLVDQKKIGGKITSRLWFGPYATGTTYQMPSRTLAPNSQGVQNLSTSLNLTNLPIKSLNTSKAETMRLMVAKYVNTNVLIPGFLWSHCTLSNTKTARTLLSGVVKPATIGTKVGGAQVNATVRDGSGAAARGTLTETMSGWSHHKKHTVTVRGTLSKGVYDHSFRKAMTGLGMKSATVVVGFAGRTTTVKLHI